ncbi:MAG: isoprenylcysteine carboxylmethyltransferase family protein [Spirochaetales bacterium]|nr:isoprenylcysteine carboxylmethyltransferase family protein [Spirochaetales bacterium]
MKHHEHNDKSRGGEHVCTDTGQAILLVIFFVVWITDSFIFHYSMVLADIVPIYVRLPVSAVLLAASALLALPAHKAVFGTPGERPPVITAGVYRIVRHPMYCGSWLFFLGIAVTTLSIASLGVAGVVFFFYVYVARHEEIYLTDKYAEEYGLYQASVRMLFPLPRLRKRT